MSDLPKGWVEIPLSEILISIESGSRPKGGVRGITEGIPSLGGEHLNERGGFNFDKIKYVPKNFALRMTRGKIKKKDVLIVKDGATTGKVSFVDNNFPFNDAVINEHVFICRIFPEIDSKFVFRFLFSEEGQKRILANFKGSAQGGINLSFAPNTLIPLASLNEQKRIVEKLDKLLAKVGTAKERLDKIPGILKKYRQSVLHAAVSGELTKDWREKNEFFDSVWSEIEVRDIISSLRYGTSKKMSKEENGFPILRIPNIQKGFITTDDIKYAKLSENEFHNLRLQPGDILMIRSNGSVSLVGRTAVVTENEINLAFAGYLIRIRPNKEKVIPKFLNFSFHSYNARIQIELPARSTSGVNNINSEEVKSIQLRLPPLEEQKEIVNRVDKLLSKADEIEERYKKAKEYVDKLSQSILAKAFRGELVPQAPNDEPASELLERIKAEKEAEEKKKKRPIKRHK